MQNRMMRLYICVVFLALGNDFRVRCRESWFNTLVPLHYKRYQSPANNVTGSGKIPKPIVVVSYVTPQFVTDVSMKNMDFSVDMEILVEWYDNRLCLPTEEMTDDSDNTLPADIVEKIWYPSVYLDNCKGNGNLVTTTKYGLSGLINVGKLWTEASEQNIIGMRVNYRKTFVFTCDLDFTAYPFDVQRCAIQLTWNYNRMKPVLVKFYTHNRERPSYTKIGIPPGFVLTSQSVVVHENDTRDPELITELRSITFTLRRLYSQHLMLVFFPSLLIVILSWLSFWLGIDNPAPRVALGLTSLLTLATQFSAAQKDLPPVAKIKALDIWMFTCMFMVFASLLVFGIANFLHRAPANQKVQPKNNVKHKVFVIRGVKVTTPALQYRRGLYGRLCNALRPDAKTSKLDYVARICFPLSFVIFNIYFWCTFYPKV